MNHSCYDILGDLVFRRTTLNIQEVWWPMNIHLRKPSQKIATIRLIFTQIMLEQKSGTYHHGEFDNWQQWTRKEPTVVGMQLLVTWRINSYGRETSLKHKKVKLLIRGNFTRHLREKLFIRDQNVREIPEKIPVVLSIRKLKITLWINFPFFSSTAAAVIIFSAPDLEKPVQSWTQPSAKYRSWNKVVFFLQSVKL